MLRAGVWQQKSCDKAGMRGGRCINAQKQIKKKLKGPNSFWGLRAGYWKILKRAQLILEGLRAEGWVVGVCQRTMLHWRLVFWRFQF